MHGNNTTTTTRIHQYTPYLIWHHKREAILGLQPKLISYFIAFHLVKRATRRAVDLQKNQWSMQLLPNVATNATILFGKLHKKPVPSFIYFFRSKNAIKFIVHAIHVYYTFTHLHICMMWKRKRSTTLTNAVHVLYRLQSEKNRNQQPFRYNQNIYYYHRVYFLLFNHIFDQWVKEVE